MLNAEKIQKIQALIDSNGDKEEAMKLLNN